jgi:hypothetical protein
MNTFRPAGRRFRAEAIPLALAALLAVSLPAGASGHSGGGHSGGGHSSSHSGGGHSSRSGGPHGSTGRTAHAVPGMGGHGHGDHGDHGHFDGHGHFFHGGGPRIFLGGCFAYDPFFFDFYYPFGYWGIGGGYWGPDYDPYYNGRPREYERDDMGALDLDLSPAKTQVYVNGQYMGIVDDFDGWPDYLWLPQGTYDVVFYLEGYKTIARQITVYPGNVLDLDDKMEPGPSTRPEDLAAKSHERRDQRLSEERERGRRYSDDQGDDEGWRDRVRRDRGSRHDDYRGRPPAGDDSARGRLILDVQPEDASVYIDGRFVGTGSDLSMMRAGLPLAVGDHKLAIVRPGRQAQEKTFTVKAGEDVRLDVSLNPS